MSAKLIWLNSIKIKWLKNYFPAFVGVHNVTALSNLITWQKVDYDFSYHQMEFPCNINVFITSEGDRSCGTKGHFEVEGSYWKEIWTFALFLAFLFLIS